MIFHFFWKNNFKKITLATESVTDKVTEDNNNITKDDKGITDTSDHIHVVEDGNSSTLHDSIMQHLDKGITLLNLNQHFDC